MSSLSSAVGLLVAVSDLALVTDITRAINADLPKNGPLGTIRPSSAQLYARPRRYYTPTPNVRPVTRQVVPHTPVRGYFDRYDPVCPDRPVPAPCCPTVDPCACDPVLIYTSSVSPIEPPWKHLPPVRDERVIVKVQVVRQNVELFNKGALLDITI